MRFHEKLKTKILFSTSLAAQHCLLLFHAAARLLSQLLWLLCICACPASIHAAARLLSQLLWLLCMCLPCFYSRSCPTAQSATLAALHMCLLLFTQVPDC